MFSTLFWQLAGERAAKSFAQSLAAVLSAAGLGLLDAPWPKALSTAGMVALLSVLTSIASSKVGASNDPSAINPAARSGGAPVESSTPASATTPATA